MKLPLPVDDVLDDVVGVLQSDGTSGGAVVLQAPPGSGKTTRVPPALADTLPGRIVVLEPRRMAARAAARRVAQEDGSRPGDHIGWHVRFDRKVSDDTRIVFMTEGILLRQIAHDPFLDGVSAVVLDEFHERSVLADLALALTAAIRREVRDDLSLVVMSATLDAQPIADFLDCPVVETGSILHPVDIRFDKRPDDRRIHHQVTDAVAGLKDELDSDAGILTFLPGMGRILRCREALQADPRTRDLPVDILHGSLSGEEQDAVLRDVGHRRVILATNVAESSVTVPGVRAVVDAGLAKIARLDRTTGLDRLDLLPIAKDSAEQRAGRAGRLGPGICRRLWTARDHRDRPKHGEPAIRRTDLAGAVLSLLDFGEPDPRAFTWFERPDERALDDALELLDALGATEDGVLTDLGRAMARLPLHPRLSRFLLEAHHLGATTRGAELAAWISDGGRPTGDLEVAEPPRHTERLARRLTRQVERAAQQLSRPTAPSVRDDREAIARAALCGWPDRLAKRRGVQQPDEPDSAVMVGGTGVVGGHTEHFVALGVDPVRKTRQGEWKVTLQTRVDPDWLDITKRTVVRFDADKQKVVAVDQERAGMLVLSERPAPRPDPQVVRPILYAAAKEELDRILPKNDKGWDRLLGRLRFVARVDPHPDLPDGSPASLLPVLDGLCARRASFDALQKANWTGAVLDRLPWPARRALDERAPERLKLARGRPLRIDYPLEPPDSPPILAARIQQFFGTKRTPTIRGAPVLLHLLAPNGRPQQITTDLEGFWERTYFEVRKELRRRYPKHAWPDDPHA